MRIKGPYNASLLSAIAQKKEITYQELKESYCDQTPPGIVSSRNVMFDSDLDTLEAEGFIKRNNDLIIYIGS